MDTLSNALSELNIHRHSNILHLKPLQISAINNAQLKDTLVVLPTGLSADYSSINVDMMRVKVESLSPNIRS